MTYGKQTCGLCGNIFIDYTYTYSTVPTPWCWEKRAQKFHGKAFPGAGTRVTVREALWTSTSSKRPLPTPILLSASTRVKQASNVYANFVFLYYLPARQAQTPPRFGRGCHLAVTSVTRPRANMSRLIQTNWGKFPQASHCQETPDHPITGNRKERVARFASSKADAIPSSIHRYQLVPSFILHRYQLGIKRRTCANL
jgi:hypothetical protein